MPLARTVTTTPNILSSCMDVPLPVRPARSWRKTTEFYMPATCGEMPSRNTVNRNWYRKLSARSHDPNLVNSHRRSILYIVLYSTALWLLTKQQQIECKYNKQIQCTYLFFLTTITSRYYSPYQPPSRSYCTV